MTTLVEANEIVSKVTQHKDDHNSTYVFGKNSEGLKEGLKTCMSV